MLKHVLAFLFVVCVFVVAPFLYAYAQARESVRVRVPVCAEDERYLKGRGDFDGTRWERYTCVSTERVER